jgi:hypothetical protein
MATRIRDGDNSDFVRFIAAILFQVTDTPVEDIDSLGISACGPRKLASICVADYRT